MQITLISAVFAIANEVKLEAIQLVDCRGAGSPWPDNSLAKTRCDALQQSFINHRHCETAQLVKQSSKIPLLLPLKFKWHLDQQIFTVFANASGVKQSSTFVVITIAGSPRIIPGCRVGFASSQ